LKHGRLKRTTPKVDFRSFLRNKEEYKGLKKLRGRRNFGSLIGAAQKHLS
jgi:hypothetical protein